MVTLCHMIGCGSLPQTCSNGCTSLQTTVQRWFCCLSLCFRREQSTESTPTPPVPFSGNSRTLTNKNKTEKVIEIPEVVSPLQQSVKPPVVKQKGDYFAVPSTDVEEGPIKVNL